MATYLMFGEYSGDAMDEISTERTKQATAAIADFGGELQGGYALLGQADLVLIVDFPGNKAAMKASVALSNLLGIAFSTAPAVSLAEFDELIAGG